MQESGRICYGYFNLHKFIPGGAEGSLFLLKALIFIDLAEISIYSEELIK